MLSRDDAALVDRDPQIQGMSQLLDPDRARDRLAGAARPAWGDVGSVQVDYLRYKPGTSLVAGLVAQTGVGERRAYAVAGAASLGEKLAKPVHLGTRQVGDFTPQLAEDLVLMAPLGADRALKGARRVMEAPGDLVPGAEQAVVLRYKPGRRLVARLDSSAGPVAVARVHAHGRVPPTAAAARSLSVVGVDVAAVHRPRRHGTISIVGFLNGEERFDGTDPELLAGVGRLLAQVHAAATFPGVELANHARSASAAVRAVTAIAPKLSGLAERSMRHARASLPSGPLVLVHGDLSVDQVLVRPSGLALLDLDRARLDVAGADAASWFAAEAAAGRIRADADPAQVLRPMLASYAAAAGRRLDDGLRPLAAVALLQRAAEPFRLRLHAEGWTDRVAALVHGAAVQAGAP